MLLHALSLISEKPKSYRECHKTGFFRSAFHHVANLHQRIGLHVYVDASHTLTHTHCQPLVQLHKSCGTIALINANFSV